MQLYFIIMYIVSEFHLHWFTSRKWVILPTSSHWTCYKSYCTPHIYAFWFCLGSLHHSCHHGYQFCSHVWTSLSTQPALFWGWDKTMCIFKLMKQTKAAEQCQDTWNLSRNDGGEEMADSYDSWTTVLSEAGWHLTRSLLATWDAAIFLWCPQKLLPSTALLPVSRKSGCPPLGHPPWALSTLWNSCPQRSEKRSKTHKRLHFF